MDQIFTKDETFEQLIRNSFDMIVLIDENGIQRYVSESCERILGYNREELVDIPVIENMIHPDDREKVQLGLRNIFNNTANGGTQYRHRHKDGTWIYLEAFGSNQLDNPFIESVVLNVRDISERKKAEEDLKKSEARLKELNATKDRFFSIISHDLRSPFNGILGLSELLIEQIKEENYEELEEYVSMIQQSAEQAFDLFNNLLQWSRAHTNRISFNPEDFNLNDTINEVIGLVKNSARQKSLTIIPDLPPDIPVTADKAMVETILRNLISNSIKFTEPGGKIGISIEKHKMEMRIVVSDTGIGIDSKDFDRLFRIEHSQSTLGTNNETGAGLGLLLCKEFVDQHGGEIWAEQVPVGSRFIFSLPG